MGTTTETRITSTQAKDAIYKAHSISSSASEIDAVANVIDPKLAVIHHRIRQATNKVNTDIIYISSGDSTSSINYAKIQDHYNLLLTQLGLSYYDNSYPGQTTYDWLNNVDNNTLSLAIANSRGADGENTILEFSLGINDYNGTNDKAAIKLLLKSAIQSYILAKPKAFVFMSAPIRTGIIERDTWLSECYSELAIELDLYLFSRYAPTSEVYGNPLYYYDTIHPNRWGARRWLNALFSTIVPLDVKSKMYIQDYDGSSVSTFSDAHILPVKITSGYYSISGGTYGNIIEDSNWRRYEKVAVVPNSTIVFSHLGTRNDVIFYSSDGNYVSKQTATATNNTRIVTVPANAYFVGINITLSATSYILLKDLPTLHYQTDNANIFMQIDYIINRTVTDIRIERCRESFIIDNYGKIPDAVGQTLKIDSLYKMKWSI